jgi:perosamine synthetase
VATVGVATKRIPLSAPVLGASELRYLEECVRTNWVSYAGPFVTRFENELARAVGSSHGVAVASGTAALHLALVVAGVGPDDAVIVPDLTFIATANAVRYCGAEPIFADVTSDTWQLDVDKVAAYLASECDATTGGLVDRESGRRVRAVIPVHALGHPVDMDPLLELAHRYGLRVVEDATESLGATYRGRPTGTLGDLGCFSFNGNKIITSGGGGMIVTAGADLAERARYLSTQARDDATEYVHHEVGFNYRLTNVQAAIGLAQLERLPDHVERKRAIAARYAAAFEAVPALARPTEMPWARSTFWLYTVRVGARARRSSREVIAALAREGIEARPLWAPLHEQRPYRGARAYRLENARRIYDEAVSLPSSVDLSPEDQDRVIGAVLSAVG